jgi:hypothetical protein
MKAEGHLGRCYLKGRAGDAAGYNLLVQGDARLLTRPCQCGRPRRRVFQLAQTPYLKLSRFNERQ